jgi:glycosyltransferase involved in cell wall biosynthesis
LGKIDQKEMAAWYFLAHVVCIPSLWPEPFGRIAIEALQFKKPIITSGNGGLREILANTTNTIFVDVKNVEKFADSIIHTLKQDIHTENHSQDHRLEPDEILNTLKKLYQNYE